MKNFNIITIFPKIFESYFSESIIKRARDEGNIKINIHNLRDWTDDKRKTVDDTPYGGGAGMVLKIEPIYKAVQSVLNVQAVKNVKGIESNGNAGGIKLNKQSDITSRTIRTTRTILFSAKGKKYTQSDAKRLSEYDNLILICGRYEGVDERVAEYIADEEISIGDYVLTGGEIPAMVLVDSIARLLPGVLGNLKSLEEESFGSKNEIYPVRHTPDAKFSSKIKDFERICEYPQYTKPENFKGWKVPEVLLSGNHKEIEKWRKENWDK